MDQAHIKGGITMPPFFIPEVATLLFIIGVLCFLYAYTKRQMLPFRLPKIAA